MASKYDDFVIESEEFLKKFNSEIAWSVDFFLANVLLTQLERFKNSSGGNGGIQLLPADNSNYLNSALAGEPWDKDTLQEAMDRWDDEIEDLLGFLHKTYVTCDVDHDPYEGWVRLAKIIPHLWS